MSDVALKIDNLIYGGWTESRVEMAIGEIASTFELTLSAHWGQRRGRPAIMDNSAVQILIDDELVIDGWIDELRTSYDHETATTTITGRSRTADLVDCSAGAKISEWKDRTLLQIAADIGREFGVTVRALTDVGEPFAKVDVSQGESAGDFLQRLCAARAVFPMADAHGNLTLVRAGEELQGALVLGKNIKAMSGTSSSRGRFSPVIVKGDGMGNIWADPDATASSDARATDVNVARYRPKIIISETSGDAKSFADRAQFEVNVRAGKAKSYEYTLTGWRTGGATGPLWQPNKLVTVDDPEAGIDTTMLVERVVFTKNEEGTLTQLSVVPPAAYDLIPVPLDQGTEGALSW